MTFCVPCKKTIPSAHTKINRVREKMIYNELIKFELNQKHHSDISIFLRIWPVAIFFHLISGGIVLKFWGITFAAVMSSHILSHFNTLINLKHTINMFVITWTKSLWIKNFFFFFITQFGIWFVSIPKIVYHTGQRQWLS